MQQEKVKTPQPISRRGARTDRAHAKVVRELDIRGQTAMEALLDVDNFIDAAVMAGVHQLSIIHGKGTGVLRAAVHFAKSIDGLIFKNNVIRQNTDYPAFHHNKSRFRLLHTRNVKIEKNNFEDGDESIARE